MLKMQEQQTAISEITQASIQFDMDFVVMQPTTHGLIISSRTVMAYMAHMLLELIVKLSIQKFRVTSLIMSSLPLGQLVAASGCLHHHTRILCLRQVTYQSLMVH